MSIAQYAVFIAFPIQSEGNSIDECRNSVLIDYMSGEVCFNERWTAHLLQIRGNEGLCFMADLDVAEAAKNNGTTRASTSF